MSTIKADKWVFPDGNPAGTVLQVQSINYTQTFATNTYLTERIPVTGFFVNITPKYANSKILLMCQIAMGFSDTPQWSWYIDRTGTGAVKRIGVQERQGNRMNGYHGGPRDFNALSFTDEVESYAHCVMDYPETTNQLTYQVCLSDLWSGNNFKYVNRSSTDSNNGFATRGTSTLTVMEIAQ